MAEIQVNPAAFVAPALQEPQPVAVAPVNAVATILPSDRVVTSFGEQDRVQLRSGGNGGTNANLAETGIEAEVARQITSNSSIALRVRYDQDNNRVVLELIDTVSNQVFTSTPRSAPVSNIATPSGNEVLNALLESV